MASTYSPSLKLELIGNGDQSGTWGTTTNNNLGTLLEQAITGVQNITMVNADYTLTNFNGVSDEARNAVLVVGGTNSAIRQIIIPLNQTKTYIVKNSTSGGYAITIGASTGTTASIPNGVTAQVYFDGTNCYSSQTGSAGNFTVNGTLTATGLTDTGNMTVGGTLGVTGASTLTGNTTVGGTLGVAGNTTVGGTLGVTGATNLSTGTISGVVTAPTAAVGTNTTQLATTAFVLANAGGSSVAGGFVSVQYFTTAGSTTWTRPSGIKKIYVYVIGAGGGGLSGNGGTGGGGGGCAIKTIDVTSISSIAAVVGSGGAIDSAGSSSTFANPAGTITAGGGGAPSKPGGYSQGGTGGTATGGDLNIPGQTPGAFQGISTWGLSGGVPAFFGVAGAGGGYITPGGAGVYGGGGGGSGYSGQPAGVGGDGIIVVYEYN